MVIKGVSMRKKIVLFIILVFVVLGVTMNSYAQMDQAFVYEALRKVLPFEKLEMAGYLKNETSLKMAHGMDEFMKFKNIVNLQANYNIKDNVDFFTTIRWFHDGVYSLEESRYTSIDSKEKNRKLKFPEKMLWLRDCFVDIYTDRLDIRAGKQQVVWGTADGIRILDMINPLDYSEWTLPNYSDIRIPLWMLNIEGELLADGHLQVLLIPDYQANYYGPVGGPFTLRTVELGAKSLNALPPFVTTTTISERPKRNFENTKLGLRWRNVIGAGYAQGLEYTLNYYHGYDFASAAYTAVKIVPGGYFKLTRRAEGIDVFGGTFSKTVTNGAFGIPALFKGWTVRGEYAWITHGAMNYGTDANIVGTVDVDQFNYVLGFDKNFWTNWLFSFQFIQMNAKETEEFNKDSYVLLNGATRGSLGDQETTLSLKISTDFMHERVKPEVLILHTVGSEKSDRDWRISPKVSFEINDRWQIAAGAHIFEGEEQLLSGQFDKNDQVFFETKYSF